MQRGNGSIWSVLYRPVTNISRGRRKPATRSMSVWSENSARPIFTHLPTGERDRLVVDNVRGYRLRHKVHSLSAMCGKSKDTGDHSPVSAFLLIVYLSMRIKLRIPCNSARNVIKSFGCNSTKS